MKQKWLIVVDSLNSAIGIAAKNRFGLETHQITSVNEHVSFKSLMKYIGESDADAVLFAWKNSLLSALYSKKLNLEFQKATSSKLVFLSIVDHIKIENQELEQELFGLVDFYFVSSLRLLNEYSGLAHIPNPIGMLHDLPNHELIQSLLNSNLDKVPNSVIWVGNSRWGIRQGYKDHKGYKKIIVPLFAELELKHNFQCTVVDSATKRIPNYKVLEMIARSEILIQASQSEGTGLPVLEAIGLGTTVLTTEVGIVEEFQFPKRNIFSLDEPISKISHSVLKLVEHPTIPKKSYIDFIYDAKHELPNLLNFSKVTKPRNAKNSFFRLTFLKIKWFVKRIQQFYNL